MNDIKLNPFTTSYLKTALEEIGEASISSIDENHLVQVKEDCIQFEAYQGRFLQLLYAAGITAEEAGKNFWLARNEKSNEFEKVHDACRLLLEQIVHYGKSQVYREGEKLFFTNLPYDRIKQRRLC